ncbi:hypothetical protein [Streptomyces sp. TLI_146]|uniref:hypothetical protein n=1 Tax=Streptomyces sp. TLI_146 TaxID=1938858 RepID=UPI000CBAC484|nr:hypothetical protein [Streptomyces sp. TLI_146]PKV84310.1 hypothetical protein BX283_1826 [Streptomyces sp. TLI_146]
MSPTPPTQIILSTSRANGLVAIPYGEEHRHAARALEEAGFQRLPGGAFAAPLTDAAATRQIASALVHRAYEHGATITTSPRPYLGDFGDALAARLPGTWSARLELYYNPLVQEDLIGPLWDSGDLLQALLHDPVPSGAVLKNGLGTELLLIERPGHSSGYLLGAFATEEYDDNWEEPNTPRSIVLPGEPDLAARAVANTFLPAYSRALHHRRLDTVLRALDRIRSEHETLQAIKESGRYSDGVPLADARMIPEMERTFADYAWLSFRDVLEHAPVLLSRCRPAMTPWPQDAAALDRLRTALADSQETRDEDAVSCSPSTGGREPAAASGSPPCPRSRPGSPAARGSSARPAPLCLADRWRWQRRAPACSPPARPLRPCPGRRRHAADPRRKDPSSVRPLPLRRPSRTRLRCRPHGGGHRAPGRVVPHPRAVRARPGPAERVPDHPTGPGRPAPHPPGRTGPAATRIHRAS